MCASCGCGAPDENHGDPSNLTMSDIQKAAIAANITPQQVAENIAACC